MPLQQVNLYLPELRPKQEWLTLSTLALSVGGLLLLFLIFYGVGKHNLKTLEAQVIALENQKVATSKQLEVFTQKNKPLQNNHLDEQLDYLRVALQGREQVGRIIEWQNLGNSEGFSRALTVLARESMSSIALEHILLSDGGQLLQCQGKIREPQDIATYLQRLQQAQEFSATRFGILSVARDKHSGDHLFALGFEPVYQLVERGP